MNRKNNGNEDLEYQTVRFWNPPVRWELAAGSNFYGRYIKSAYFKKHGNGDAGIKWTARIKESGEYDCYAYIPNFRMGFRRQRTKTDFKYLFTVHHDDGTEEVSVGMPEGGGWAFLGDFYFSEGDAVIELSDKTESILVFGDAVKWVKK